MAPSRTTRPFNSNSNSNSNSKPVSSRSSRRRSSSLTRMTHPCKSLPARLSISSTVHPNDRQLTDTFSPSSLEIRNASCQHRQYHTMCETGGRDGETRMLLFLFEPPLGVWVLIRAFGIDFAIEIVSDQFAGRVSRLSAPPHSTRAPYGHSTD